MTETLYDSARRRLPELEAEVAKLSERLKAVNAEIAVARSVLKAAPDADQLSGNSEQLPRRRSTRAPLVNLSEEAPGQSEIIAARVNGKASNAQ